MTIYVQRDKPLAKCDLCGRAYWPANVHARYCGVRCRREAHRRAEVARRAVPVRGEAEG